MGFVEGARCKCVSEVMWSSQYVDREQRIKHDVAVTERYANAAVVTSCINGCAIPVMVCVIYMFV
jgi:hypothetical protein